MSLLKRKNKNEKTNIVIQENPNACMEILENSVLKQLLNDSITDISFNGVDIYYQDNEFGRMKSNIKLSNEEAYDLIKKIANYMLKPFNVRNQILDVSFGHYRLNAIHPNLARANNNKVITFSIRIIAKTLRIKKYDNNFAKEEVFDLLECFVKSYQSIVISGKTGSGKTELQKFLSSYMNDNDRVILIEENYETQIKEIFLNLDVTSWIYNENNSDQLSLFIKMALRNNPDWIIVAETRGSEAYYMIQAVMTGHSAITTLHSENASSSLDRLVKMCKDKIDINEKLFKQNIASHIKIAIHMEKIIDCKSNKQIRRISEICEYLVVNDEVKINKLYYITKDNNLKETYHFGYISDELKQILLKNNVDLNKIKKFIKKKGNKQNEKKKK